MTPEEKLAFIRKRVGTFPDFPKPGILFRDIFSILRDVKAHQILMDLLFDHAKKVKAEKGLSLVVGLDARGFLFGPQLALYLGVPFVPVRKRGKLPGEVSGIEFTLEYGQDEFQVQKGSVKSGDSAIVVDDLLATGGSLSATCKLLETLGVNVVECLVIMELKDLKGREKLTSRVHSLLQY